MPMIELIAIGLVLGLLIGLSWWQTKKNAEHWKAQFAQFIGKEQGGYMPTLVFNINRKAQDTVVEQIMCQVTAENSTIALQQLNALIDRADSMTQKDTQQQEAKRWTG